MLRSRYPIQYCLTSFVILHALEHAIDQFYSSGAFYFLFLLFLFLCMLHHHHDLLYPDKSVVQ